MVAIDEDTNVLIGKTALKQEGLKRCLTVGVVVINRMVFHRGYIMRLWTARFDQPSPLSIESIVIDFIEASYHG